MSKTLQSSQFEKSKNELKNQEINNELKKLIDNEVNTWKKDNPSKDTPELQCIQMLGGLDKFKENAFRYIVDNKYNVENMLLSNGEQPVAIVMVGAPSAGKSSSIKELLPQLEISEKRKENIVQINSDGVMEAIYTIPPTMPELPRECRNLSNKINDFTMKLSKRYKKDLIYDATGRDYYPHSEIMKQLHDDGYIVILCIVMIDKDIIVNRVENRNTQIQEAVSRGQKSRDQTPVNFVKGIYDSILGVVEQYILIPKNIVSEIFVYDNSSKTTPLLLIKRDKDGLYTCNDDNDKIKFWFNDINICKETSTRGRSDSQETVDDSENTQELYGGTFKKINRKIKTNKNKIKEKKTQKKRGGKYIKKTRKY